jgi:DNA-directed RNA polymerase specialized sigma24 family protein
MADWSEVVRRHGPLVWRTAYRLLSHEADAADCFQRTFLAAVELAAALARLTTARALEQLRKRYREAGRSTTLADDPPAARPGPGCGVFRSRLTLPVTSLDSFGRPP